MSGMYPRQWAGSQQQAPPRKRRLVTYYMQPLSEQAGYQGPRQDGHRFGVNRILRLGENELITAGRDGIVRRWDVSSAPSRGRAADAARRDAIEGGGGEDTGESQSPCTGIFASHTDWVTGLAVAAGRIMASSSNDGTIKLWDLAAADIDLAAGGGRAGEQVDRDGRVGKRLGDWGREEGAQAAGLANGDGARGPGHGCGVVAAGEGFRGRRDVRDGRATATGAAGKTPAPPRPSALATVAGHGDYVKCLTYAPEKSVLVSGGLDKRILLWDLQRMAAPLMVLRTGEGDMDVDFPAAGQAGRGEGNTSWWGNEGAWSLIRDPSRVVLRPGVAAAGPNEVLELCRQKKGSVYCVDASVDASLVASGGTDRMIRLLDPRAGAGHAAKVCKLDGHRDNVRCVRIDEGGTRVVSGSTDGTIRVWDVRQQCCLGVYELSGGSVWAMQPSPRDFDVYYSGGRGRRVYRTDFRAGESTLVCMTNSEVLDMALEVGRGTSGREQSMSMWLSSTEPSISLWGGEAGGGKALRTGRPAAAAAEAAGTEAGNSDVYDFPDAEGDGIGIDESMGLLDGPVGVIRGQPGVVRHTVLNNRRHVLTEDDASPPNVALWDITKAKQIEAYPPGTVMEDKERLLLEIIAVRPWFTIDTHLGTPLVSLSEGTVFLGELYAVDARGERQTFLASLPPLQPSQPGRRGLPLATDASAARAGGAGKGGDGPARATKARSVQDEVKVNLGDAVLRGLFSRWIDQHLRLDGEGMASSRRRGVGGGNGGAYSSGESDSEDSDRGRGSDYESRSTSPGSGLSSQASAGEREGGGRRGGALRQAGSGSIRGNHVLDIDLAGGGGGLGGGRAIGDDTVLWVTETDLGGSGGLQRTLLQKRVGEFDGREGEDVIPHWVMACVLHGEFRAKEQPKVAFFLAPWIPPEQSHPPSPPRQLPNSSFGKRGGGGGGGSGGDASSRGSAAVGGAGAPPPEASQRFTAPAQMLVSKVMAYVMSHDELREQLDSTIPERNEANGSEKGEGIAPRETPEDLVEVLCGDRVVEPHLYIGAIQQYIWNPRASGTLFLHYRSRWRPRGKNSTIV